MSMEKKRQGNPGTWTKPHDDLPGEIDWARQDIEISMSI